MGAGGLGSMNAPHSPYLGERDYIESLNRQGNIANLRSELSGKGPANVMAGRTSPALSGLTSRASVDFDRNIDPDDTINYQQKVLARDAAQERINVGRDLHAQDKEDYRRRTDPYAMEQYGNTVRGEAGRQGDFTREEGLKNAQTELDAYWLPDAMIKQDREARLAAEAARNRFQLPAEIRAGGQVGAAQARAGGQVGAAEANAGGRTGSAAIRALEGLGTSDPGFTDPNRVAGATAAAEANLPTQMPPVKGQFPAAQLDAYASEHGLDRDAAIRQLRQFGYVVQ
jgi:hypothetical protein